MLRPFIKLETNMKIQLLLLAALCGFGSAASVHAQDVPYPDKPVKVIVPANAGGPSDIVARMVSEQLTNSLKQPFLVDNRPGATNTIGTAMVVTSRPDGATLLITTADPITVAPLTLKNLSYDARRDLATVSLIGAAPLVLYVNTSTNVHNVKELVALANSKKGNDQLSYASNGQGSVIQMLMETFSLRAGVPMLHVPYKAAMPMLQDLAGGQVQVSAADIASAAPLVEAGKIRPIAVTSLKRSAALPNVPTFAEQGVVGMDTFNVWWGMFAPAATPKPVVDKLANETAKVLRMPEVVEKLAKWGIEPSGMLSEPAGQFVRQEQGRWQTIYGAIPPEKLN